MEIKIHTNKVPPAKACHIELSDTERDVYVPNEQTSGRLVMGIGAKPLSRRKLIILYRRIISLAKMHRIAQLSIDAAQINDLKLFAECALMANYEYVLYRTEPKEGWNFVRDIYVTDADIQGVQALRAGEKVAHAVNACRTLSNTPGGDMTPAILAEKAIEAAKGTRIKVSVLKKRDIERLHMGGIAGVSRGSSEEPRFIVMEHMAGGKEAPIVLVGKAITFDSGGLNLKPSDSIYEMHMDMSGGAAVIHAIALAANLGIKKNIVGLIPAAENMPSGSSYRPGDVLKSMSGKTIEITNTDAEGRVILADALTYAEKYKPRLVVDVATLTGAAHVALGSRASALFTPDEKLENIFRTLGEESGDYVWPLPMWNEYEEEIKGTFGDIVNSTKHRYGGAITGAMFLYQFAKDYPWVHLDIAPRMTPTDDEYLAKGAAGAPVRLLAKLLETY